MLPLIPLKTPQNHETIGFLTFFKMGKLTRNELNIVF